MKLINTEFTPEKAFNKYKNNSKNIFVVCEMGYSDDEEHDVFYEKKVFWVDEGHKKYGFFGITIDLLFRKNNPFTIYYPSIAGILSIEEAEEKEDYVLLVEGTDELIKWLTN